MSGPLRVAVDANALAWGWSGIPKYIDRIARELVRDDRVELTLLANSRKPFATVEGARQVYARRKGGVVWRNGFLLPWLRRERPDVFWAPETLTPLRVPVPYVVTVHDLATVLFPRTKPWRQRLAYGLTLGRGARRAASIVAVSETTARDVERLWRIPRERVRVIPNGVDDAFTPGDREAAASAVERRHGIVGPYVLAVGSLEPRKGLDVLIAAAALARGRGRPWRLVLAGAPGFDSGRLLSAAARADAVALGPVGDDELVPLYRAAEALAAPSLYEGFGVTPLEAMACGTPAIVAAGSGGLEEVAGPAAIVVGERTPDAWLAAVDEARRRREELAPRGIGHARRFRWPSVAEALRRVLEEAARP